MPIQQYGFDNRLTDVDWGPDRAFGKTKITVSFILKKGEKLPIFQMMVSISKWFDASGNQTNKPKPACNWLFTLSSVGVYKS